MSTVTRESQQQAPALPPVARGDAIFSAVAAGLGLLALIAKLTGILS